MKLGDIVRIGNQTLMCGDAGDPKDVKRLFDAVVPDLVFTSPPYLSQRKYTKDIPCWDTLMQRIFKCIPYHVTTQILVNLGLVHRKGEWTPYYNNWIEWMRLCGWKRFGHYTWDKMESYPGDHHGRLASCSEFIFHFNKKKVHPHKILPCKTAGLSWERKNTLRTKANSPDIRQGRRTVNSHKIPDGVLRIYAEKGGANKLGHPAVFPVALPLLVHASYSDPGDVIYDPFVGSGTSLISAEMGCRRGYGMDISSEYCAIAEERLRKHLEKPKQGNLL